MDSFMSSDEESEDVCDLRTKRRKIDSFLSESEDSFNSESEDSFVSESEKDEDDIEQDGESAPKEKKMEKNPFLDSDYETDDEEAEAKYVITSFDIEKEEDKFDVIVCDPPWNYGRSTLSGCAKTHYSTMTMDQLMEMNVLGLAKKICALLMWTTGPFMEAAIALGKKWGFEYKTMFYVWVKLTKNGKPILGLGNYTRSCAEFCLLFTRGRVHSLKNSSSIPQLIQQQRREHSRKPEESFSRLDDFFSSEVRKIELFSRENREKWYAWGNEVGKFVPDESLNV